MPMTEATGTATIGRWFELVRESGEIRISLKRVDLVDASGPLGDILTIL